MQSPLHTQLNPDLGFITLPPHFWSQAVLSRRVYLILDTAPLGCWVLPSVVMEFSIGACARIFPSNTYLLTVLDGSEAWF